jgi:hypothetical protein
LFIAPSSKPIISDNYLVENSNESISINKKDIEEKDSTISKSNISIPKIFATNTSRITHKSNKSNPQILFPPNLSSEVLNKIIIQPNLAKEPPSDSPPIQPPCPSQPATFNPIIKLPSPPSFSEVKPPPIDQLRNYLFEEAAKRLAATKKNRERIRWLKFACLADDISKKRVIFRRRDVSRVG